MKKLILVLPIVFLITTLTSAQDLNKVVFGRLVGDDAGDLTVSNGEAIGIELFVRTDPDNPGTIWGVMHGLMSENVIIAERNGMTPEPAYYYPHWESFWVDGPYVHDPDDDYPIPEGWSCEMQAAIYVFNPPWYGPPLDTQGEWDLYGSWLMVTNTGIPTEQTYYPFEMGWYPHSGRGTIWSFEAPPGGWVVPEQSYCGLYFEPETTSVDENQSLPEEFSVFQNHPNPFNAATTIKYSLPEKSQVTIEIYNILGRKIETLVSGIQPAGSHSVVWDAENQPSGIYFYRIDAGEYVESKNCLLLK